MSSYAPGVTLITCTGDRPQALALCTLFVMRQAYSGPLQWITVNDASGFPPGANRLDHRNMTWLYPEPAWRPGQNTLARNLLAAIPEVRYDKVLFIEDDDWYAPNYVEMQAARLAPVVSIVGAEDSRYYHLPSRRWRLMRNQGCASLCQSGIRAELLPFLADICKQGGDFIDAQLWQCATGGRTLTGGQAECVGIKGLPGRPGIGVGHRPDSRPAEWTADPELTVLKEWIGEDVELYREFLC